MHECVSDINFVVVVLRDPLAQFEVEKREHEIKMKKMEAEMEQVFEMKVQEKMQKLKDIEADVSLLYTCFPSEVRVIKALPFKSYKVLLLTW